MYLVEQKSTGKVFLKRNLYIEEKLFEAEKEYTILRKIEDVPIEIQHIRHDIDLAGVLADQVRKAEADQQLLNRRRKVIEFLQKLQHQLVQEGHPGND